MALFRRLFSENPEWVKNYRLTANRFRFSVVALTMGAVMLSFLLMATLIISTEHLALDGSLRVPLDALIGKLLCVYVLIIYGFLLLVAVIFTINEVNRAVTLDADSKRAHLFLAGPLSPGQKIIGKGLPPVILLLLGLFIPFHAGVSLAIGTPISDLVIAYLTLLLLVLTLGAVLQLIGKPVESDGRRTTSGGVVVLVSLLLAGPLLGSIGASGTLLLDLLQAATGWWVILPAWARLHGHAPLPADFVGVIDLRLAGVLLYLWLLGWLVRWTRQKYRTIGPYTVPGFELTLFLLLSHACLAVFVIAAAGLETNSYEYYNPVRQAATEWASMSLIIGAFFVWIRALTRVPDAAHLKIRFVRKLTGCRIESDIHRPSLWAALSYGALIASLWLQLTIIQAAFGDGVVSARDLHRFGAAALAIFILLMVEIVGAELLRLLVVNRSVFYALFGVHLVFLPIILYFNRFILDTEVLTGVFNLIWPELANVSHSSEAWTSAGLYGFLLGLLVAANVTVTRGLRACFAREEK